MDVAVVGRPEPVHHNLREVLHLRGRDAEPDHEQRLLVVGGGAQRVLQVLLARGAVEAESGEQLRRVERRSPDELLMGRVRVAMGVQTEHHRTILILILGLAGLVSQVQEESEGVLEEDVALVHQ